MGENFCLRWNDHHDTFFASAEKLCHGSLLTDVVLSAGGTLFQAHKLVLSVCSKFFQDVFAQPQAVPQAHNTVIYLKDVDAGHMQQLLSYMYRGQVDVEETQLAGFLKTATGLQIKGLSEDHKPRETRHRPPPPPALPPQPREGQGKREAQGGEEEGGREEGGQQAAKRIKEEMVVEVAAPPAEVEVGGQLAEYREEAGVEYPLSQEFLEPPTDPDTEIWNRMNDERLNKAYPCQYCGMSFSQNWLLKRHWKTHTGDKPFKCTLCSRTFSLRDSCVRHLRTVHKELVVSDDVSGLVEDMGGYGGAGLGVDFEPSLISPTLIDGAP